jgi:hypothetical protein
VVNNSPGKIKRRERRMAKEKDFFDDDSDLFESDIFEGIKIFDKNGDFITDDDDEDEPAEKE